MTDEITSLSLTEAAQAIRDKKISSVEMTQACLARMERLAPVLDCIAEVKPDAALAAAAEADADLATGNRRGPLHGVPLAHKDMYYRRGRISACGSKIRADFVPDQTSTALTRLDEAGALDIARLNMVEFALGLTGHNEVVPTPRNPWNTDHMTGGSSSGAGSAVAARLVYGAMGSDTGGSIRFPASCCGLIGMKPTYGRVSRFAVMPLSHSLDTLGPLTRTVADNAAMLGAIAGPDGNDATASPLPVPDYLAGLEDGIKGLRVAIPENLFYDPVDSEVRVLMDDSVQVMRQLGADIIPVKIPDSVTATNGMNNLISMTEGAALHQNWIAERSQDYGRQTLGRLITGLCASATRYIQALNLRHKILAEFAEAVFEKADILHLPSMIVPVPTLAESDLAGNPGFSEFITKMGHCTRPFNYLGLPGLSVPCGFTKSGLPAGMQLVGRPFDEATLYRAARAYERETGCTDQAPAL
jgi:aspartyl-tRNA(Asn)/glutamyl-tRNA(Gln) amidotransferase subunit A